MFLTLLLVVCISAISAVSAEDLNATGEVIAAEDAVDEISVSEDLEVLNTTYTPQTSNEIQSAVDSASDGDTVILDGYYLFNSTINVDKQLNFVGKNDATVDGNNSVRLFFVNNTGVMFNNIIFKNGFVNKDNGGAIYGDCIISECDFVNNTAYYGGALYGSSAVKCNFINNSATGSSGGALYGGSAVNCSFINNSAKGSGGALYRGSAVNCSFVNNSAFYYANAYGGALYDGGAVNCTFIGNYANGGGGAAYSSLDYNFTNCVFINNAAKGNGGAINCIFAINCTFKNNNATENGGAMYNSLAINCNFQYNHANIDGGAVFDSSVSNSIFEYNSAENNGGAMNMGTANNCTFNNNNAKEFGGAVNNVRISRNSRFSNNTANNGNDMYNITYFESFDKTFADLNNLINSNNLSEIYINHNYAFDLVSESNLIKGINITRNITIYGNGYTIDGANAVRIFNVGNVNATFHNLIFIAGKAIREIGGAINGVASVINCTFIDNSATGNGGALYGCNAVNCTFIGNSGYYGGALYGGSAVNCTFIGNSAYYGGAIFYAYNVNGSTVNCNFVNNSARNGGALYGGSAVNCNFVGNFALGTDGGAIYSSFKDSYFLNCSFINNSGGVSSSTVNTGAGGGAIYCDKMSTIENCSFINNWDKGFGGAVNVDDGGANLKNCIFVNNKCNFDGGAVYRSSWNSNVNFYDCSFINNSADYGGALYARYGFGSISNSIFINNSALDGFAIYSQNTKNSWTRQYYPEGNITNCKFVNNTENAIHITSGRKLVVDCIFDIYPTVKYSYNSILDVSKKHDFLIANLSNVLGPLVNKTVTFNIDGTNYTVNTNSEGLAIINYYDYLTEEGNYTIPVSYDGDNINYAVSKVFPLTFTLKHDVILTLDDLTLFVGEEGYLIVNLSDSNGQLFSKTVTFNVGGIDYNQTTDSNGIAKFKITDYLTSFGTYYVDVSFAGDDNYNPVSTTANVIINKYDSTLNVGDLSFFVGEEVYLVADFSDARGKLFNKNVTFSVGNVNYNVPTDLDGQAKIKITDYLTDYGSYDVGVSFSGDSFDNPISTTANVALNRYDSILDVNDSSFVPGEDAYVVADLSSMMGQLSNKNVTFIINNKRYTHITDSKGIAKINIADYLTSYGYYTVIVDFAGDNYNKPVSANVNVSVVSYKGILTVNQVGKYCGDTNLTFNLINSKTNQPISNTVIEFTFSNGVSDRVSTDSDGNANYDLLSSLFAPDNYVVNASVSIPYVDINAVQKEFVVSEFIGEIEISQAEDCRVLNIRLFNSETGEVFKNFNVNLAFTPNKNVVDVKTDEKGEVNYTMNTFEEGTYTVTASVKDSYSQFAPKTLEFMINNKGNSIVSFVSPKNGLTFDYLSSGTAILYLNWCTIDSNSVSVDDHPEAIIGVEDNVIIVSNLTVGSYTLRVTSTPDDGYNSVTRTTSIAVKKIDSYVSLTPVSFDYGKSGNLDVGVNGGSVELENIRVLNHPEAVITLTDNKITVSNLSAGTYTLQVTSSPDDNHNAVTENATITVNKVDSVIDLTPLSFDYRQTGSGNVNVTGGHVLRSNIKVLNHPEANINIYNDVITVSGLDAGSYTLSVTSSPDENHNAVTKTASITVNKIDSTLSFTKAITFDYGGSDSTSIDFDGCTIQSGNIKVLNHPEASITFTGKVITVSDLDAGKYTLSVTSSPDDNHNAVTSSISVTVNEIDSNIRFTRELYFDYGGSDSTVLVLDGCSVDLANISIIGQNDAKITLNNGEVTVSNLDAGSYTLSVATTPNKNYKSVTKTIKVTVNKIDSSIAFSEDQLTFNQDESACVEVTVDGGIVEIGGIGIDNHPEVSIALDNNIITVSNLTYGTYTLSVVSSPDENHNSVLKTLPVTVNKMLSNVTFGDDIIFDYGDTGSTWIKVTGGGVSPSDISVVGHSEAEITMTSNNVIYVSNLDAGIYTLKVITTPDENHRSVEATAAVVVNKVNSTADINDISFDYGTSGTADVHVNGGKLLLSDISIPGEDNAKITYNGKAITVSDLDAGNYILSIITTPDKNHYAANVSVNINVNKVDSVLTLSDDISFDYGDSGSTVITAGGDDVLLSGISVVGEEDAKISLSNYKITVSNLNAGKYTLRVTTSPDKNHNPTTQNVDVVVNKVDSAVSLSNNVVFDYGGFGTVNATAEGGNIIDSGISVDNHPEAQITFNGKTITVLGLNSGTYVLRVSTNPDKNHNSVNGTASIIVNKIDSNLTIINNVVFDYGGSGSTGVIVDGCSVERSRVSVDNHNEAVIKVEGNVIEVSNLAVGNYTLRVVSTPDANHNPATKTAVIRVNKAKSSVGFTNQISFDYKDSGSATLILDGCTVKESDIYVEGHSEAKIRLSDKNVVTVSNLVAGSYILHVKSTPDSNHVSVNETANVNVNKINSKISFTKDSISFKYAKSGSTPIVLENCKVASMSIVGYDNVKPTLKDNVITVSGLAVGSYVLKVTTDPDDNYNSVENSIDVVVTKNTATITVEKSKTVAYKKSTQWSITLKNSDGKALSGIKPVLKIYKGNKLYKTVNNLKATNANGVTSYQTSGLPVGTYKFVVSVSHAGYNVNSVSTPVKVIKQTPVKIIVNTKTTKKGGTITVIVKDKTGKKYLNNVKITLKIKNGKTYKTVTLITGKFANGKGACAYSTNMLTVGSHKVTATPADIKYSGSGSKTLKIKASAKKYRAWWEKVSKGTKTSSGIK